tara:strand:- start:1537 stop:1815 length:279 start_codon:yes stop_codon:yes gene_type:complete
MEKLISLRDNIEKLEKHQHLHIVKIIQENDIVFTENRNGIFLNMKDLNEKALEDISKYLKYIEIQQKQLDTDENIKKTYANNFFNNNKEKSF